MTTVEELSAKHQALRKFVEGAGKDEILPRVQEMLKELADAGAEVSDADEREFLRGLIRHWSQTMYDYTGEFPEIRLLPVDTAAGSKPNQMISSPLTRTVILIVFLFVIVFVIYLVIDGSRGMSIAFPWSTSTPTPTSTPTSTPTPTPTSTPTPTPTLTPTPTSTPTLRPTPTSTPLPQTYLLVADFETLTNINNLDGNMGAAYNLPDQLRETYVVDPEHGHVARLEYDIKEWSAFWMKLQNIDLTQYSKLVFDIRGDPATGIPEQMKIELKRASNQEVSIIYVSGITAEWHTMRVNLADFGPVGYTDPLSSRTQMEELVFTFEADHSGQQGVVYLDNIAFVP